MDTLCRGLFAINKFPVMWHEILFLHIAIHFTIEEIQRMQTVECL